MDNHALVLNAGSSSLKFSVIGVPRPKPGGWTREGRSRESEHHLGCLSRMMSGQSSCGSKVGCDFRRTRRLYMPWLPGSAPDMPERGCCGIGHRVVHGGARFSAPIQVTRQVLDELYALVPLAPLHQPYNLAAIGAVFERHARCTAGCLLRHRISSQSCRCREGNPACRAISAKQSCNGMVSMGSPTNTSRRFYRGKLRRSRMGRVIVAHLGNGASLCALKEGRSVDSTIGFHRPRWTVHGDKAWVDRSRRPAAILCKV